MNEYGRKELKNDVGKEVIYLGEIVTKPLMKDFNNTFIFKTNSGQLIKTSTDKFTKLEYGDRVRVIGKLTTPHNFESSGRTFDYVNYLGKDGIYYEFKKAAVEVIEKSSSNGISARLYRLKEGFIDNLKKVLGEPHAALASGLVVGERASLGKELIDDFRKTGLIHIVVLSGYNITIIGVAVRRILSFLPRNIAIMLAGCGIALFGIMVGGGATVVRSCIMALVALSAELFRRNYGASRALLLAGAGMLIHNPLILLYDPSFQLSFLATLGLVTLAPFFAEKFGFVTERFGIRELLATTIATQIFVSPLIFYSIGQLSIVGILVNMLVLPLVPLSMLVVSIAGIAGFFSELLSTIAGWAGHILLSYELLIVRFFAKLPFATLEVPPFSGWIVAGLYTLYAAIFLKLPSIASQLIFAKKSST